MNATLVVFAFAALLTPAPRQTGLPAVRVRVTWELRETHAPTARSYLWLLKQVNKGIVQPAGFPVGRVLCVDQSDPFLTVCTGTAKLPPGAYSVVLQGCVLDQDAAGAEVIACGASNVSPDGTRVPMPVNLAGPASTMIGAEPR